MANNSTNYKINIFKSTPSDNFGTTYSTNFESHNELTAPGPKLVQSDLHSQYFAILKEKALEMPFFPDHSEFESELSCSLGSNEEDIYKEDLLSEGFNSSQYVNNN